MTEGQLSLTLGDFIRRFARNRGACAGAAVVVLVILATIAASKVCVWDPYKVNPSDRLVAPGSSHWFGTDPLGRDIFSRIVYGGRVSLAVGAIAVSISGLIGGIMGLVSGYAGGQVDSVIMRFVDIMLAFPSILLALLVVSILGPGLYNVVVAVGLSGVGQFARLVRGSVLQIKENTYVEASRALGCSSQRIMVRHVLPNILAPVVVFATMKAATSIISAASLSFLGLGAQPPTAEWGSMLSQGRNYFFAAWWVMLFPGMALLVVTLALNLIGDGLRDATDPKRKM
jgi:peptide/nickel transport system permease protein